MQHQTYTIKETKTNHHIRFNLMSNYILPKPRSNFLGVALAATLDPPGVVPKLELLEAEEIDLEGVALESIKGAELPV